ncbi:hypothetical protein ACEWY4_022773 [Coilia grayii]|uniref:Uncharacterized protein n=1 Tax=Coilia grayii TaxID=363190 RepID=A0ABD1J349_9TELE
MDVNLTISLIRGQMGVVIEKAVTVAVETVLGEMMKVVSIKFDEFRKEMNAKEKENENIRQMLEISRCQMRAMRKYLSVSAAKDDHQSHPTSRQQVNQFDSVRVPEVYLDQPTFPQPLQQGGISNGPLCRRTVHNQTRSELRNNSYPHGSREDHCTTLHRTKAPTPEVVTVDDAPQTDIRLIASDGTTTLLTSVKQEAPARADMDRSLQEAGESGDATQARKLDQPSPAERELPDEAEPQPQPQPQRPSPGEAAEDAPSPLPSSAAPVVKEEELDAEVVPIKQEPQEVEVEVEGDLTGPSGAEGVSQRYLEGTRTLQITAGAAMAQSAAYYSPLASSSTYASSQPCLPMVTPVSTVTAPSSGSSSGSSLGSVSAAEGSRQGHSHGQAQGQGQGQGQGRPWLRDLGLYEQYKQARAELRRRSQLRRKQLEQDLPQALLADLVKERREKTRLRVARWRARRKLQACLMGAQSTGAAGAATASAVAAAAAAAAAAQAGQSVQRVASGLRMQVQMQTTGVAGQQQQRLGGRQQQQRQPQGRAGLQYGGRVGGAYPFGPGSHQALSGDAGGSGGGGGGGGGSHSHTLSAQAYGSVDRFSQHRAAYLQHGTQGTDTDMYQ